MQEIDLDGVRKRNLENIFAVEFSFTEMDTCMMLKAWKKITGYGFYLIKYIFNIPIQCFCYLKKNFISLYNLNYWNEWDFTNFSLLLSMNTTIYYATFNMAWLSQQHDCKKIYFI